MVKKQNASNTKVQRKTSMHENPHANARALVGLCKVRPDRVGGWKSGARNTRTPLFYREWGGESFLKISTYIPQLLF